MVQVGQKDGRVSILRDTQNPSGQSSRQLVPALKLPVFEQEVELDDLQASLNLIFF